MLIITRAWIALKTDRRAVTAVEYAMIVGLIAAVCVATVTTLGTNVNSAFTKISTSV